jgi:outer membrane protein OmpA-like peptidoglycan-associated protein
MKSRKLALHLLFLWTTFILVGCSTVHSTTCPNGHAKTTHSSRILNPRTGKAIAYTGLGAAAGAAVGSIAGEPVLGGLVGGSAGLVMGLRDQVTYLKKLGVNVLGLHGNIIVLIPTDKLFEPSSVHMLPSAPSILKSVTSYLRRYPDDNIQIAGHTDLIATNSHANNVALSLAQAKRVYDSLRTYGLPLRSDVRQITYSGHGASEPIASNDTIAGMAANRRIQITLSANCIDPTSKNKLVIPEKKVIKYYK